MSEQDEVTRFTLDLCCGAERYRERTGHTPADRKQPIARLVYVEHFDVVDQRVVGVWRWEPVSAADVRRRKIKRTRWHLDGGQLVGVVHRKTVSTTGTVVRQHFAPRVCRKCGEQYPLHDWVRELRPLLDRIREETPGDRARRSAYELFRGWVALRAESPEDAISALERLERDTRQGQSVVARVCAELSTGARWVLQ